MTEDIGTPIYMAPELQDEDGLYGSSIDVYAFAILAYEIVTGETPFSHLKNIRTAYQLTQKIKNGERPIFNDKATEKMIRLIKSCWSENPYSRPSFEEIFRQLSTDFTFSKEAVDEEEVNSYIRGLKGSTQTEISQTIANNRLSGLLFDVSKLDLVKEIRKGTLGSFHLAVMNGEKGQPPTKYTLKVVDKINTLKDHSEFLTSIELQASLNHPGIIRVFGFAPPTQKYNQYSILFENAPNGSLKELINRVNEGKAPENWETLKAITIFGTAAAMTYIHQHDVVLADLRPMSILLDDKNYPKIGGFANSFFLKQGTHCHEESALNGIARYMAPELSPKDHLPFSNKIDVYSYAMLLLELFTLKRPFCEIQKITDKIWDDLAGGKRPTIDESIVPEPYVKLIESCWSQNPDDRPTFIQIVYKFMKEKELYFDFNVVDRELFDDYVEAVIKDLSFW